MPTVGPAAPSAQPSTCSLGNSHDRAPSPPADGPGGAGPGPPPRRPGPTGAARTMGGLRARRAGRDVADEIADHVSKAPQRKTDGPADHAGLRSEEHTSELQSLRQLVCRLLLEKK